MAKKIIALTCAVWLIAAAAPAADWPHWRGPNRNGTTPEDSGFDKGGWPPEGPAWKANVGGGGTSPIVVGDRVYVMGRSGNQDCVYCLDATDGAVVWKQQYPCPPYGRVSTGDKDAYKAPCSTPEYDTDTKYLYTLSVDGDLNCWDTRADGRKVWGFNLYDKFRVGQRPNTGGGVRDYGYVSSPYVWGELVLVEVGSKEGNVMSFGKRTGGTPVGTPVWKSQNTDPAGHAGGMTPMIVQGIPCLAVLTVHRLNIMRMDKGSEGKTLAAYPFEARFAANLVTPSAWKDLVILSTHVGPGDDLVHVTPGSARRVQRGPHSEVGTPIYHDGRVYRCSGSLEGWEMTADKSHKLWTGPKLGNGGTAILTGDNKLIAKGRSRVVLCDLSGKTLSEFKSVGGWPCVVFANGRVYCKDNDGALQCFVVSAGKKVVE